MTDQPTLSEPNQYSVQDNQKDSKFISEYLQLVIEDDMRAAGLNPLNKDDVKKFWALRGILD